MTIERIGNQLQQIDISDKATVTNAVAKDTLSTQYTLASTETLLDVFAHHGWNPVAYRETRTRTGELVGKQKHTIVLANDRLNTELVTTSTLPRIMIKNSHDGTSALQILSGLFEKICANGLIVGASAADIRLRHVGLTDDKISQGAHQCLISLVRALETSERMKAITLDREEQLYLAGQAIPLIYSDEYIVRPEHLLNNWRRDQQAPTLWNTFNTIQEHAIRGGIRQYRADGSRIKSRAVNNIDRSIKINQGIWDIAEARMVA